MSRLTCGFNSFTAKVQPLPVGLEGFRLGPQLRVTVQRVHWNHERHILGDGDSADLHRFFGSSFQTWNRRVEPVHKVSARPRKITALVCFCPTT